MQVNKINLIQLNYSLNNNLFKFSAQMIAPVYMTLPGNTMLLPAHTGMLALENILRILH